MVLPLNLVNTAKNRPILVETKNGESYSGTLISCDGFWNLFLKDVVCTSPDGERFWNLKECFVRGSKVSHFRIPDEVTKKAIAIEKNIKARKTTTTTMPELDRKRLENIEESKKYGMILDEEHTQEMDFGATVPEEYKDVVPEHVQHSYAKHNTHKSGEPAQESYMTHDAEGKLQLPSMLLSAVEPHGGQDFIPGLCALAFFLLALVSLKKFQRFQKPVRRLQESLMCT